MSNRLHNLAKRITSLAGRKIHPSEKGVLLALADDARDHLGGRSKLTAKQLATITGFSRRAIGMALAALAEAGHISRETGEPGAPVTTLVHPGQPVARGEDIAKGVEPIATPARSHCQGSYRERDNNQSTIPLSPPERAREPAAPVLDEVDQVFAAWDAFHQRAGLPPVARGMARRGALAARIAEAGLGRTLMVVDRTERARAEKRAPPGQGDMFWSFDAVFGVGSAAKLNLFDRMLDGQFTPAEPKVEPAREPARPIERADEGEAVARIRAAARAALGEHAYGAWLADAGMRLADGELVITAPSAFAADYLANNIVPKLRRSGMAVRVSVERITA